MSAHTQGQPDQVDSHLTPGSSGAEPPRPEGRLLSTMNEDGSRNWLTPWVSKGAFWHKRRVVAYGLIAVFTLVPYTVLLGMPLLLLDVQRKEFHILGRTFLPTDTLLMAFLMVSLFMTIFAVTALFGRVWCGWACPQTVYMEFLYRPLERLIEGDPAKKRKGKKVSGGKKILKYALFLLASMFLAHTFLAYFVPVNELAQWVTRSPVEHPTAFLVMAITTGLMMFDFAFFREQTCIVACPYGRIQAAMLDKDSMIVTYDEKRGEPRGRSKKSKAAGQKDAMLGDISLPISTEQSAADAGPGDCIDCHKCVTTCPTGIDIRNGLQMECIGCAQCIDACNDVMTKVGKPKGLIRYSSRAAMQGDAKPRFRPRLVLYPAVGVVMLSLFFVNLFAQRTAQAQALPRLGAPFYAQDDGTVINQLRARVTNRGTDSSVYTIATADGEPVTLIMEDPTVSLEPAHGEEVAIGVNMPASAFNAKGQAEIHIVITGDDGFEKTLRYVALGPQRRSAVTQEDTKTSKKTTEKEVPTGSGDMGQAAPTRGGE